MINKRMKRVWGGVIALSMIASVTLVNVGKLELKDYLENYRNKNKDMLRSAAAVDLLDYTLDFNPSTNKFINSETGAEITSSALATMGVSYKEVSGTDTITLNNVNFATAKSEGIRIVDTGTYTTVEVVLKGENIIQANYESGKDTFSGIGNENGGLYFSGDGSLDVSCTDNSEEYATVTRTETYAVHAATVKITDATINATVNGNKGFGVKCGDLNMVSGALNVKVNGVHNVAGVNAGYGVSIKGGLVNIDVESNGGMAYGIIGGIQDATDKIEISGGDVNVKVNGKVEDVEVLKELVKKYESEVTAKGTTVNDVIGYIDTAKQQEAAENLKTLQGAINRDFTGGYTSFEKIKNAIVAVLAKVGGKGFQTSIVDISAGAVDIEINGLHKDGLDISSSNGEGLTVDNKASLNVYGDVDSCSIYGADMFSTGIRSTSSVQINEGKVDITLKTSTKMSESTTGLYMPSNNFLMNTGAYVNIDVANGFGMKFYGGNCHINDGRAIIKGGTVAYDGNVRSINFMSVSGVTGGTDVIAVANDYEGKERVKLDTATNRWLYKYVDMGKLYDYTLFVNSTGTVYQNNASGSVINTDMLAQMGLIVGVSAGVVQVTMDNANFATKAADAINIANKAKFNIKDGTVNRIAATGDGSADSATIKAYAIETSGNGKLYVDNRYTAFTSSLYSYKNGISTTGDITINDTQLYIAGLDNCKTALGIDMEGNLIVNSGSIYVQGGYKTEYVKGAYHAGGVFTINAGEVEIDLYQTSYDSATKALSATGLEFTEFNINGGKITMKNHSVEGYAYGFYSNGSMGGYEYEQRGGIVNVISTSDVEYDGYSGYTGCIDNCANIGIFDGYCELSAHDLTSATPVLSEGAQQAVSVTAAKDSDGNLISSPSIDDINYYEYILIEPMYHLLFEGNSGTMYKNINGDYIPMEENGWYAKLDTDGTYDLVLNGFHFSTGDAGVLLTGDDELNIILEEGSNNTLRFNYDLDAGGKNQTMCIYSYSDGEGIVNVTGNGTLNLIGNASTTNMSKTSTCIGFECKEVNIEDATVVTQLEGPKVYGIFADNKVTVNNANVSYNVEKNTTASTAQAMGMVSTDYQINDSKIDIVGDEESVGIYSTEGVCNINNSYISVDVVYGGAIASADSTVITNSEVYFPTEDPYGVAYGIYTLDDKKQDVQIEGSKIVMDVVGTKCIGIKVSGDIELMDTIIDMKFDNISTGAAGIQSIAQSKSIVGNVDIDNCNINIAIDGTRTTGDNQGIVSDLGSVDIYGSAIKIEIDAGDGDGIQAGKYFSDMPSEYDNREISLVITECDVHIVNNGKDISEEVMGITSTQGEMVISGSNIKTETTRASETGDVMGLMATNDIYITEVSVINNKIAPESNMYNYVTGIYSEKGKIIVDGASTINSAVTGKYVNGLYAKDNIAIHSDVKLNIELLDFTGVGMGVYSNAGTVSLDGIKTGSIIKVKAKEGLDGTSAGCLATMGAEITTKNCDMTMDASGEDAYVYAAADSVKIDGGKFKAKATSAVVGTDNVTYVSGDASSVDATTTVVSECSEDYKDTYTEDDLTSHPKASVLKTKKYIEVDTVPMYAYMYDATAKKLYQVSDDETNKVELVGSTMPTGLAIEDDKLKMNDFRFTTANDVILKVEGDGTIYVEGTNNYLCNVDGEKGTIYEGIYGTSKLDITGTSTAQLKINSYSHTSARAVVAEHELSISNIILKANINTPNGNGIECIDGGVMINGATVDVVAKAKSGTVEPGKNIYGIVAFTGLDILNSTCNIRGNSSAIYLENSVESNIKGSIKASEDYDATTLSVVSDINTSYTDCVSKYKIFTTEIASYSVAINWADLEYECEGSNWNIDKGEFENYSWKTVNTNGDLITVVNDTADEAVYAKINYNPLTGFEDVTGEIRKALDYTTITNSSIMVSPLDKLEAKLVLGGKLSSDAASSELGEVTVVLSESATL